MTIEKRCFTNIGVGVLGILLCAGAGYPQNWLQKTKQAVQSVRRAKQGQMSIHALTPTFSGQIAPAPLPLSGASGPVGQATFQSTELTQYLQTELARADRLNRLQEGIVYQGEKGPFLRSTFLALSKDFFGYSGTIFKINYQGQEEIYGVIAAHVIVRNKQSSRFVHKKFLARVYAEGKFITIPAEIVQVGAPDMLDVALVKFRPEDEDLFEPLTISPQEITGLENVRRQGFILGEVTYMPKRYVRSNNELRFSSHVKGKFSDGRPGFCGSAVVNEQNELVGIHTGSHYALFGEDSGFATHAKFLEVLVEAYHNGGNALYPFELAGQTILSLRPDEYISKMILSRADGTMIDCYSFNNKTSYEDIEKDIQHYGARYIELTVRRVNWKHVRKDEVLMDHSDAVVGAHLRTYVYDLQSQKIVSDSKYTVLKKHFFPRV